ncbi:MAG: TolC family protein, partial [Balneolaceae bacterium]
MKRLLTLTVLFLLQAGVTDSAARENRGDAGYRDLQRAEDGEMLTLDEAIRIGLENNYGIQIFRNTAEIASNNRTLGNAGFLPSVAGTGSRSEQVENSRFETDISGGETQGARSANTSAGIALDWTLFDGMQMFINHQRLGEQERLGMDELRFR